jgi:hypothetical protein
MKSYTDYYNGVRTHRSLNKDAPVSRPVQRAGVISARAILGVLLTSTPVFKFSVHTTRGYRSRKGRGGSEKEAEIIDRAPGATRPSCIQFDQVGEHYIIGRLCNLGGLLINDSLFVGCGPH